MEGNDKRAKAIIVAALSVALIVLAAIGSIILMRSCGVELNDSSATNDEVTVSTVTEDEVQFTVDSNGWSSTPVTPAPSDNTTPTTPDGKEYVLTQDWDKLKEINTEIKAWIHIPNTDVNYPVLKHDGDGVGNQYYLHRNFDKSYLFAGSVFIDYRSSAGVKSRNIITHGHNMNNGSMYHDLVNYGEYKGDLSYYKKAPTIFFNTEDGVQQWIIFSVYKTNTLERHGDFFNYLVGDFSSSAQFMNYVYNVRERSFFDVPVPVNENDQILTLSTCSYEYTDFRTVVVARKVRNGENVKKYIDSTELNPDPLWPDVYYTDYNTKRPDVTSFKTEYDNGGVSWYDGKGNLQGNEWLPGVKGRNTFTVSFTDASGNIIKTERVSEGKSATPPPDPQRPDDKYYTYTFKGWQLDYTNVDRDMIIAPSYTPTLKEEWR